MKKYTELYDQLCKKYKVRSGADYMEAVKTMKKNGITKEELEQLMAAWNEIMGVK